MKKFIIVFALLIGASFYNAAEAQNINVSINVGRQPAWGPVGYDYVDYYYLPEIDCYYNVNVGLFYYLDRGRWISARYLPYGYRNYDLYGLYKVVLTGNNPWRYNRDHHRDYARYRGYRNQVIIRDSHDNRYRDSRNNRVTWYSDNKSYNNQNKDYRYNNNNRQNYNNRDNNYNNNRQNQYSDYNKNNNRDKNNQYSNNNNNNRDRDNNKAYSDNNRNTRSDKNESFYNRPSTNRDTRVTRSSSSEKNSSRLAQSNGERRGRNR